MVVTQYFIIIPQFKHLRAYTTQAEMDYIFEYARKMERDKLELLWTKLYKRYLKKICKVSEEFMENECLEETDLWYDFNDSIIRRAIYYNVLTGEPIPFDISEEQWEGGQI